jgi:type IV pilus assembly protein PilOP
MTAKLVRNKVTIAAALAVALVSLLAYVVVVSPKRSRASELDGEIATAHAELGRLQAERARVAAQPKVPLGDLKRLRKAMPSETNMPGLMRQIAHVARRTGISFDSITPSEPVPLSGYQKVPLSLVFQGNFFELKRFLFRVRSLVRMGNERLRVEGRLVTVDAIDFAEGSKKFPQVQATLTANAFVFGGAPAPAEAPPPDAASADASASGVTP